VHRSKLPALAAAVALMLPFDPVVAEAHAVLMSSDPQPGAQVPAGKLAMQFRFNSRIDRQRSRLVLVRSDHSQIVLPIASDGPPEMLATSADVTAGANVVKWQVLAVDGHITRGEVRFTAVGR
jgi:copper resistance protein C